MALIRPKAIIPKATKSQSLYNMKAILRYLNLP